VKCLLSFFAIALALLSGCATPGTVGKAPTEGLLVPVIARADAYIVVLPDALTASEKGQYEAAKALLSSLPNDKRIAAAQSWFAVDYICTVHDAFVQADGALKEPHKSTYLRSTQLLRKLYEEAFKADGKVPPVAPESQPGKPFQCPDGTCNMGK